MPEWLSLVLFFGVSGLIYFVISTIGEKIVDKGSDAVNSAFRNKNKPRDKSKTENLSDRYQ